MSVTHKLSKYPEFLKPYVISSICIRCAIKKKNLIETIVSVYRFIAPWITEHKRSIERATKHLKPVFEERFRMYEKYGDNWPDKPVCRIVPPSIPLPLCSFSLISLLWYQITFLVSLIYVVAKSVLTLVRFWKERYDNLAYWRSPRKWEQGCQGTYIAESRDQLRSNSYFF